MAKLPDIQYRRPLQPVKSVEAARLPGKLRTIDAAVSTVRGANDAVQQAFESEARLDADRRYMEAQKDYTVARADLVQEYHNTDKPLENFESDMTDLRQKVFQGARKDISGRAGKYLEPRLGGYDTQATIFEKETLMRLTESRTKLHLAQGSNDRVIMATADPSYASEAITTFNTQLTGSSLSQVDKRAAKAENTTRVMTGSINTYLRRGDPEDIAAAVKLVKSAAFDDIPDRQREAITKAVVDAGYNEGREWAEKNANLALIGNLSDIDSIMAEAEGVVAPMLLDVTEKEQEDRVKDVQGELAFRYLSGRLADGNVQQVLDTLKSEKYNAVLSTEQTDKLYRGVQNTKTQGSVQNNAILARNKYDIKQMTDQLKESPELYLNSTQPARVDQLIQETKDLYTAQGKAITEPVFVIEKKWQEAKRGAEIALAVYANTPEAYTQLNTIDRSTFEGKKAAAQITEALTQRNEKQKTDPMQFHEDLGMPVTPLPRNQNVALADDVGWLDALVPRLAEYRAIVASTDPDLGGPLKGADVGAVNQFMRTSPSADDMLRFAGEVVSRLDPADATAVLDQLVKDDELGIFPAVGKMMNWGQQATAENILVGQGVLTDKNSTFKLEQVQKVDNEIMKQLENVFPDQGVAYEQTFNAIKALYAQKVSSAANRGEGLVYQQEFIRESVTEYTGGILNIGDQAFLAPAPGVNEKMFTRWIREQTPETLPAVIDGDGVTIPAQDIADGLYDTSWLGGGRFFLTPTDNTGVYYITDSRSRNRGGPMSTPGGLLMSAEDPFRPAVVTYDGVIPQVR